eukprot:2314081-Lingulodinium_polyedra.AAC.1
MRVSSEFPERHARRDQTTTNVQSAEAGSKSRNRAGRQPPLGKLKLTHGLTSPWPNAARNQCAGRRERLH